MNTECLRIADQLRRAFAGEAWHGPNLKQVLAGITAEQAVARPLPAAHSIWELALHIEVYTDAALAATKGTPMPKIVGTEQDWRPGGRGADAWASTQERFFSAAEQLAQAIEGFGDERLQEIVPGRTYDFYFLFHGIVQHGLYHGGQIALLKKAVTSAASAA